MTAESDYRAVLAAYPADCQAVRVEELGSAGGFSGARFWRVASARGPLCLRRWPPEHPAVERLRFIQAVLRHVREEGFELAPVPIETLGGAGFVRHAGHLWELTPWMPGLADYHARPSAPRLEAALAALARFHVATQTFPPTDRDPAASPGIKERIERLRGLTAGGLIRLQTAVRAREVSRPSPLDARAERLFELFPPLADRVLENLTAAALVNVPLAPVIRDIWHAHVLFEGERVTGLIDFGGLRPDTVATDIARLLGSLVGDDQEAWRAGLAAYGRVRALSESESSLVPVFDQSTVLLSGFNWLTWIYLEGRQFEDIPAIVGRLDGTLARLGHAVAKIAK